MQYLVSAADYHIIQIPISVIFPGTTVSQLIEGIQQLTNGAIVGRFFGTYPSRCFDIKTWLAKWIKQGTILYTISMNYIV